MNKMIGGLAAPAGDIALREARLPLGGERADESFRSLARLSFVGDSLARGSEAVNAILLMVLGGEAPYAFSVEGLPKGASATTTAKGAAKLCLKVATSSPGDYPIRVQASDHAGAKGAQAYLFRSDVHGRIALEPTGPAEGALALAVSGIHVATSNRGVAWWIPFLTGQRTAAPADLNFGVPGDMTSGLLARLDPVVAAECDGYVLIIGTNNLNTPEGRLRLRSDWPAIWSRLRTTGRPVIALPILPRALSNSRSQASLAEANAAMHELAAGLPGLTVYDPSDAFRDPDRPHSAPRVGRTPGLNHTYDGLHPTAMGAYALSAGLAARLNAARGPETLGLLKRSSTFAWPPTFTVGTGKLAGRAQGRAPDGWRITSGDGGLKEGSFLAYAVPALLADSTPAVRIVVAGEAAAGYNSFVAATVSLTSAQCATLWAGDRLHATCPVEISGSENVGGPYIHLAYQDADVRRTLQSGNVSALPGLPCLDSMPEAAFAGMLATPQPPPPLTGMPHAVTLTVGVTLTSRRRESVFVEIKLGTLTLVATREAAT